MHLMEHERTVHAGIHDAGRTAVGPAHVARLDEAERVVDAERREDTQVALGEHGGLDGLGGGLEGRRLEGGDGLEEGKGDDGNVLHC